MTRAADRADDAIVAAIIRRATAAVRVAAARARAMQRSASAMARQASGGREMRMSRRYRPSLLVAADRFLPEAAQRFRPRSLPSRTVGPTLAIGMFAPALAWSSSFYPSPPTHAPAPSPASSSCRRRFRTTTGGRKGFLDRAENPLAPVKPLNVTESDDHRARGRREAAYSPPQVVIELLGESFSKKVVAAPAGAEVVIKNVSKARAHAGRRRRSEARPAGPDQSDRTEVVSRRRRRQGLHDRRQGCAAPQAQDRRRQHAVRRLRRRQPAGSRSTTCRRAATS